MKVFLSLLLTLLSLSHHAAKIGDEFSKIPFKEVYENTDNPHLKKLIENTVLINAKGPTGRFTRGTGFYLGKHKERHLFLTNAHVLNREQCRDKARVSFISKNLRPIPVRCHKTLFSKYIREKLDITLFTIKERDLTSMKGQGLSIDWESDLTPGTLLAQAGFGSSKSMNIRTADRIQKEFTMRLNFDDDCAVVSPKNKTYLLPSFKVRATFTNGCDAIQSDSGSALINRETGKVVGLLWGAGPRKISSEELWSELMGQEADKYHLERTNWAMWLKELKPLFEEYMELN